MNRDRFHCIGLWISECLICLSKWKRLSFQKKVKKLRRGLASHLHSTINFASRFTILRSIEKQVFLASSFQGLCFVMEKRVVGRPQPLWGSCSLAILWCSRFSDFPEDFSSPVLLIIKQVFPYTGALGWVFRIQLKVMSTNDHASSFWITDNLYLLFLSFRVGLERRQFP